MNIFDGHEDKTPEELANELGISDLSVIENAGREVVETLGIDEEVQKILAEYEVSKENANEIVSLGNNDLRTNDYTFEILQACMKVNINNGDIWQIGMIRGAEINLNKREEILIEQTKNGKKQETIIDFSDFKKSFQISVIEKDWTNQDKRILLGDIKKMYGELPDDLIADGTYVHNKGGIPFYNAIGKAKTNFQTTKNYDIDFPSKSESWSNASFENNFAIHKSYFAQYQVRKNTEKNILPINSLEDISIGNTIVNIQEIHRTPKIRNVKTIGIAALASREDDITLQYGNSHKVVSLEMITNGDYFITKEATTEEIDTENDELWAKNCKFEDFREGMRINVFSSGVCKVYIINKEEKIIIIKDSHENSTELKFSDIGEKFSVYSEDLRKVNYKNFVHVGIPPRRIEKG